MKLSLLLAGSGFPKLRSAVTLLESEDRRVLVDSGLCEDGDKLVAALAVQGLVPEQIDTIVTTHLHYDHCGNHLRFPNARYIVGGADYEDTRRFIAHYHADQSPSKQDTAAILRRNNAAIKDFYVRAIVREVTRNLAFYDALLAGDPRFQPVTLDAPLWLTSEIEVLPTPGHTPGHLSVVAHGAFGWRLAVDGWRGNDAARSFEIENVLPEHNAASGGGEGDSRQPPTANRQPETILIGGDAISSRNGDLGDGEPHLAWNPKIYGETREALLAGYDWLIPGHDGLIPTGRAEAGSREIPRSPTTQPATDNRQPGVTP
ncbi:MAG: MBL fold metallo-hydrolase [Acidobacteriota bacterium]